MLDFQTHVLFWTLTPLYWLEANPAWLQVLEEFGKGTEGGLPIYLLWFWILSAWDCFVLRFKQELVFEFCLTSGKISSCVTLANVAGWNCALSLDDCVGPPTSDDANIIIFVTISLPHQIMQTSSANRPHLPIEHRWWWMTLMVTTKQKTCPTYIQINFRHYWCKCPLMQMPTLDANRKLVKIHSIGKHEM